MVVNLGAKSKQIWGKLTPLGALFRIDPSEPYVPASIVKIRWGRGLQNATSGDILPHLAAWGEGPKTPPAALGQASRIQGRMSGSIWYPSARALVELNIATTAISSPSPSSSSPSFLTAAVCELTQ